MLGHPENPVRRDGGEIIISKPTNNEGANLILKTFSTFMPTINDHDDAKECVRLVEKFWHINKKAMEALKEIDTKHEETCLNYFRDAKAAAEKGEIWQLKEN